MAENKLFSIIKESDGGLVSKVRNNREYLLNQKVAEEFNTYLSFDPFRTFNDVYAPEYTFVKEGNGEGGKWIEVTNKKNGPGTPGVRSLFNKAGAVIIGSSDGNFETAKASITGTASEWRLGQNVPLMDTPSNRKSIRKNSKCTIKDLVEFSQKGLLGRETYDYSDFMYCKYLGQMPNNYLITLRRFPYPVDDYISSEGLGSTRTMEGITSNNTQSIGCLVTWMGTPGNEMGNILKYSMRMPWDEKTAQWEDIQGANAGDASTNPLNGIAAVFDQKYRAQYSSGHGGSAANTLMNKFFKPLTGGKLELANGPYDVREVEDFRDRNKIYGPVDAIKKTYTRGDGGIEFDQDITIVFDYELRYYNGINTRQALLDLLSNILNVTYTTGTFWGGGYKSAGQHQNNIFTNLNIFKARGGASEFLSAFQKDCTSLFDKDKFIQKMENLSVSGFLSTISKIANIAGGMILGGLLNGAGRPTQMMANSLLSPAPIGFWHLTVGNPNHPILSAGNMVLKNTTIEHYGPLGLDDFPTGIKVTCELTRGKPRDLRDIEKMYMKGNNRIYTSMGPKVFEMYKNAKDYNSNGSADLIMGPNELKKAQINQSDLKGMSNTIQKYFGHTDTYSIYVAACEQETGATKIDKKGTASGDSRKKGTGGINVGY